MEKYGEYTLEELTRLGTQLAIEGKWTSYLQVHDEIDRRRKLLYGKGEKQS